MNLLDYNETDLHMNRTGQLSPSQQEKLKIKYQQKVDMFGRIFIAAVICFALMDFFLIFPEKNLNTAEKLFGVIIFSFPLILILLYYRLSRQKIHDIALGIKIHAVSGTVKLFSSNAHTGLKMFLKLLGVDKEICTITINGKKFNTDKETLSAFDEGKKYTLYYFKEKSETIIVSAENIAET